MELNIGSNIKRLRIAKGLTQEQLAELLRVSGAAVSKWEAQNTYPDITMLIPLAGVFGVRVDDLLGYDEARVQQEIGGLLAEYQALNRAGRFAEASALLADARKRYPHNHRIMHTYMWDKAGGSAANRADVLLENRDEFLQICHCILDGCTDETLRLEALNMKAKLLHAQGDTTGALEILSQLPGVWMCAEQKKEQLFAKNTPEYQRWNRQNCYGAMEAMAVKLARSVRYDSALSPAEKALRLEAIGRALDRLCDTPGLGAFCLAAQTMYAELASMLSADAGSSVAAIIHAREMQFAAMDKTAAHAAGDESLLACITQRYGTADILSWQVEWLLSTSQPHLARLREQAAYMEMLMRHKHPQ